MSREIEFYFDVGSPYSYLAWGELPRVAQRTGATVRWRPMLLGGVFKATGNRSPIEVPAKGAWTFDDMQRWARRYGMRLQRNPAFPVNTLFLMRVATGLLMRDEEAFRRYLDAVFRAMWDTPRNLNDPAEVSATLAAAGFDVAEVLALADDPKVKEQLRVTTEQAVQRGVFGAPSFFVGDELFWGQDRLDFVEEALRRT
jgi:2-hydroxychromene-2-carboxylate isomerase